MKTFIHDNRDELVALGIFLLIAITFVAAFAGTIISTQAEKRCLTNGYATAKTIGFHTWCSKVVNGSTVTVQVR